MHKLSNIDPVTRRADCSACGPTHVTKRSSRRGWQEWTCTTLKRTGAGQHTLYDIDAEALTGYCTKCAKRVPLYRVPSRNHYACSVSRDSTPSSRGGHGLTRLEARALIAETAFCENPGCRTRLEQGTGKSAVDHDRISGRVRGALCAGCNTALGLLKEDPNRIRGLATYLEDREA